MESSFTTEHADKAKSVEQAQQLLGELDAFELSRLVYAIGVPILIIDEDLKVVCGANHEQLGLRDLRNKPLLDLLSPVVVRNGELLCALRKLLTGGCSEVEVTLHGTGSRPKSYLVKMAPIVKNGKFLGMLSFFDISEKIELKEELAYLKDYSENVIQHIPSGLVVTDNNGKIILANPAACEMLAAKEGLEGKNAEDVFGAELGRALVQGRYPFKSGQIEPGEVVIKRLDGVEIVLGFRISQLFDAHHKVVGMIIIFKDVTELKALRNRLEQSDRMAAIGTLASGIAHEFNNLLGAILGYNQLAKASGKLEDYKRCAQVVFECCRRAKEIVHNLLSFARRRKSTVEEIPLEELIDQVLVLVERDLDKHGIKVVRDYRYKDIIVTDVGQLQQVLLNLIINARQAMEHIERERVLTISTWEEDGFIHLVVKDTGVGIEKEHLSRIFEPFFTTKGANGSGLGLSLCYSFIKNLNSEIKVKSQKDCGSSFELILPQKLPSSEPVGKAKSVRTLKTTLEPKRVAVVATDGIMRDLIEKMLVQVGHVVKVATDIDEVLSAKSRFVPDILVVDLLDLESEADRELLKRIADLGQRAVVLSWEAEEEIERIKSSIQNLAKVKIISKPFEAQELIGAMEEVAR